ncbi:MAG: hypothetical protein JNJ61_17530 [Anaerolineae bacterium]|nr:hypothetical protein [Anaerolineae bacterium]
MTDAANAQIAFITLFTTAFLAALYVLIVVISLLRRLRQTVQRPALNPVVESVPAAQPPPRRATAEYPRIPVQSASPDQVVLAIEPLDGPTDDQRNVHKLIEFLKREAVLASPG